MKNMKNIKKAIALILMSIIIFIVLQYFNNKLLKYENIVIAEHTGSYASWQQELIDNYVDIERNIDMFSVYSDYKTSDFKVNRHSYNNILIFAVDEKYMEFDKKTMELGRFFWERDIQNGYRYIVIDRNMAFQVFSTMDCIGREVEVNKEKYTIIGVYEKDHWSVDAMSAINRNVVFIPYNFNSISYTVSGKIDSNSLQSASKQSLPIRQIFLFKVKDNLSTVLIEPIQKNLENILDNEVNIENIDIKARRIRQKIKFTYFLIVCVAMIYTIKWILPSVIRVYENLKNEMDELYFAQLIRKNWYATGILIIIFAAFVAAVFYFFNNIKLELIIDPRLIPSRPINTKEVKDKIINYFIKFNTTEPIISPINAFILHVDNLSTYLCCIIIFCCWYILNHANATYFHEKYSKNSKSKISTSIK